MSAVDLVGTLVGGRFRVERALGEGGMGSVYVAVQEPLGRRVALKVIRGASADAELRARFRREATVVGRLACPHIVTLHDFGEHDGTPYIAMELLEGETLRAVVSRGPLPVEVAIAFARDLACALRSAHEAGVLHRDVKPENVIVVADRDRGQKAKLLDFGVAKLVAGELDHGTQAARVVGTVGYIAPEQITSGASDAATVDVYALGVLLYELLAGRPPFTAPTPLALLMAHASASPPPLPRGAAPPAVEALVMRLLQKDPGARPADGAALVVALDALASRPAAQVSATAATLSPTELGALPLPSRPSIAVQPFRAAGSDDDALLAEGIGEDILTALSCFKHLFVVGFTSMVQDEARDDDARRVGQRLGVRHVLRGNVRRSGDLIRVTASLVDALTGEQVWAQRYDRRFAELFAVQDEVTREIVACVAGRMEDAVGETARRKPPHALAAYEWLARGRALHHRRTAEANRAAREALDKALEIDPEYAQAHAWLACVLVQGASLGVGGREVFAPSRAAAARALELDQNDAECHRLVAEVHLSDGDLDGAFCHHGRALGLNPNDPRIVAQRGELLLYRGELEEAARALEDAVRWTRWRQRRFSATSRACGTCSATSRRRGARSRGWTRRTTR